MVSLVVSVEVFQYSGQLLPLRPSQFDWRALQHETCSLLIHIPGKGLWQSLRLGSRQPISPEGLWWSLRLDIRQSISPACHETNEVMTTLTTNQKLVEPTWGCSVWLLRKLSRHVPHHGKTILSMVKIHRHIQEWNSFRVEFWCLYKLHHTDHQNTCWHGTVVQEHCSKQRHKDTPVSKGLNCAFGSHDLNWVRLLNWVWHQYHKSRSINKGLTHLEEEVENALPEAIQGGGRAASEH